MKYGWPATPLLAAASFSQSGAPPFHIVVKTQPPGMGRMAFVGDGLGLAKGGAPVDVDAHAANTAAREAPSKARVVVLVSDK